MIFSRFEWSIAWRYLRARRAEGGVSTMTLISFFSVTLSVFALIATLSVRAGFRAEFVSVILGANAHVTLYPGSGFENGQDTTRTITDYRTRIEALEKLPQVSHAAPLIRGHVLASHMNKNLGVEIFGLYGKDFKALSGMKTTLPEGGLAQYNDGIAIGSGIARKLGLTYGDKIKLISPSGVKTAFGTSPRIKSFEIVHIFSLGRYDIDNTRIYMPFETAASYFNKTGADELQVMLFKPDKVEQEDLVLRTASGGDLLSWSWQDASSAFLNALTIEDNVMFVIVSILVLIASMNIISGLIMLVKNKQADIAILRTIGLTQANILRVFFLCGASIGVAGTLFGVVLGCLFTLYIDSIFAFVNALNGGEVWDPAIRGIYHLPAQLRGGDVLSAIILSLGLCFVATLLPARRAARMNPVEALRDA